MRKWIVALVALVLIIAFIYWLLPRKTNIHQELVVPVNTKAFAREFIDVQKWQQWWPHVKTGGTQSPAAFEFNGNTYLVVEKRLTSLVIAIAKKKDSLFTELIFIPLGNDSIQLNWVATYKHSLNLLNRIQASAWMKAIDVDMQTLLEKMKSFYSNQDNIYGCHIEKSLVADSNYMFTSIQSKTYPSTDIVYRSIDKLKFYIQINNAQPTGYPMLNVYQNSDAVYLTKVALPVDKQLKNSGDILYKWMLKGGNILVTEVKGGPYQIDKTFIEMQNYMQDHQRIAPAIPYQSLITDRRQEPDTNKWITRLYWPVM